MDGSPELFCRTYGDAGSPVVILHGLLGSADNWHPIAKRLCEQHRVLALDLRNHGRSCHHPDASLAAMADDVLAFLATHQLASATLLGHSLGGRIAMLAATGSPPAVSSLIVVDMALRAYPPRHLPILAAMQALPLADCRTRADADAALAPAMPDPAERQLVLKCLANGPDGLHWRVNLPALLAAYPSYIAALPLPGTYAGPALFVAGGKSDYLTPAEQPALRAAFPNARFATIKDASHWVHADAPDLLLDLAEGFLAETARPVRW